MKLVATTLLGMAIGAAVAVNAIGVSVSLDFEAQACRADHSFTAPAAPPSTREAFFIPPHP